MLKGRKRGSRNKKALSSIVSTLLILLLVFISVSILWVVIRNVLQTGSEQVSLGKFTLSLRIDKVTLDSVNNALSVRVLRNSGAGDFTGLRFSISDGNNVEVVDVNESLKEGEKRTFSIPLVDMALNSVQKVEISPVFTLSSGKQSIGDIADSYDVTPTASSGTCTDTCSSLGFICGNQTICGVGTDCGTCEVGYNCVAGTCV